MTFPTIWSNDLLQLWDTGIDGKRLRETCPGIVGKHWRATICTVGKGRETMIDDNIDN